MRCGIRAGMAIFCMLAHGTGTSAWRDVIEDERELPEIEHILSDCAVLWDRVVAYNDIENQQGADSLLDVVSAIVRLVTDVTRNVRNLSFSCSLDVLYYVHDIIKQISLELSQQIERYHIPVTSSVGQALLMLDLLDSEFERTYYYLDTL